MSRIAFNGNPLGTGTVTIASPNTNSDRTVTLPDATGTLITNSGTEAISAASLTVSGASTTGSLTVNSNNISAVNSLGFRNRLINGGMVIDQRNNGAAVTGAQYTVDRWRTWFDPGAYSFQQVTDAPTGFSNSLRVTKTNTTASTNYAGFVQYIEGYNFADMNFGTASASAITLSFWVKSSITGTFTVAVCNSAENRFYGATYTINSANTWEFETITIPGDTTGTWLGATNGVGLQLWFNFGQPASAQAANTWTTSAGARSVAGSTSLGTTNGATWQITGVQLEAGSVATPFERRDYGRELMMCQRYYQLYSGVWGTAGGSTTVYSVFQLPVTMRAAPTSSVSNALAMTFPGVAAYTQSSANVSNAASASTTSVFLSFGNFSGMTTGNPICMNGTSQFVQLSAEL